MAGLESDLESDIESSKFIKKRGQHILKDGNYYRVNFENKYNILKVICVFSAIICLLFGFISGGIFERVFDGYHSSSSATTDTQNILPFNPSYHNNNPFSETDNSDPSASGIFGGGQRRRKRRRNKDECSARRCCKRRDGVKPRDLPNGVRCNTLNDENCGLMDNYCVWDCNQFPNRGKGKRGKNSRHFRRISTFDGQLEIPEPSYDRGTHETLEDCLNSGSFIGTDDCGVEYEETLDPDLLRAYCLGHPTSSRAKAYGEDDNDNNGQPHAEYSDESDDTRRRLDVLGDDGRIEITSTSYPWRAVFYLLYDKPSGGTFRCTATMISPYWAITAAHCVYGNGDWYGNWRLYKDVFSCSDRTAGNEYTASYAVTFNAYIDGQTWDYDIAWLKVSTNAGDSLGWFGFGYDSGLSGTQYFNIISHPADQPDCKKFYQYCPYTEWDGDHQQITYECDTSGGASGSGVYQFVGTDNRRILAIHALGACYDANGVYQSTDVCNTAIRITYDKFYDICYWVELDTPDHCPDP